MTREEKIEQLQSWVLHGHITTLDDLELEVSCAEYDGDDPIEWSDDILGPIGYNCCDKCGALYFSEELCWLDCLDLDENNPRDKALLNNLSKEPYEYCALCYECVGKLSKED